MALKRIRRRRGASITSLIDVIFLLLLFFMLASTFSRQAEIELVSGLEGAAMAQAVETNVLRLVISADGLTLEGQPVSDSDLSASISALIRGPRTVLAVDPAEDVTTQRLIDVLLALRTLDGVEVQIVEPPS